MNFLGGLSTATGSTSARSPSSEFRHSAMRRLCAAEGAQDFLSKFYYAKYYLVTIKFQSEVRKALQSNALHEGLR